MKRDKSYSQNCITMSRLGHTVLKWLIFKQYT